MERPRWQYHHRSLVRLRGGLFTPETDNIPSNGGASGVLYEFIAITIIYCFIAASIAELASAVPSSAGVFHWAHLTGGPKHGRLLGWFAGWWNWLSWTMATGKSILLHLFILMLTNIKS